MKNNLFRKYLTSAGFRFWLLTGLIILAAIAVNAQQQGQAGFWIKGQVRDSLSAEPLPFVNLVAVGTNKGTSTDLNGQFSFFAPEGTQAIRFSYVGYKPKVHQLNNLKEGIVIKLAESVIMKTEVVVLKGANPANRIIKLAVKNKAKNNPENITSFTYNSHNKLVIYPDPVAVKNTKPKGREWVERHYDSTLKARNKDNPDYKLVKDSAYYARLNKRLQRDSARGKEIGKFADTSYLFLNETFTERKYKRPNQSNEKVIATRTSGFPKLALAAVGTRFQPFGFYKDAVTLFNKDYINPISLGSTSRYDFTLVQTRINAPGDTTFVINYEPFDDANINGLKGQVSINSRGYAIENITADVAEPISNFDYSIKQKYEIVDDKYWFPTQLHTDFKFKNMTMDDDVPLLTIMRTYIGKIKTDAGLSRLDFIEEEMEVPTISTEFPIDKMQALRIDTSSIRERNTYLLLDSVIQKEAKGAERVATVIEYLTYGAIPYGKIEFPFNQMMAVNSFEGWRLGVGVRTNQRFSNSFTFGAYGAYGTKDGKFKYGLDADYKFSKFFDWHINLAHSFDVIEPGSQSFLNFKKLLNTESYRDLIVSRMDFVESWRASTRLRPFKFTGLEFAIDRRNYRPGYDTKFALAKSQSSGEPATFTSVTDFRSLEAQVGLSLVYGEKYELIRGRRIMLERGYPAIYLSASRGLKTDFWGDLEFTRVNARLEHHIKSIFLGNTYLTLQAGYTDRAMPYVLLFNGMGARDPRNPVVMNNAFQTVGIYEFTHSEFASFFFQHDFGSLLWKSKHENFAPKPAIFHAMGYGRLTNPERYEGISTEAMNGGLYESGLLVRDLWRTKYFDTYYYGWGLGVFYRYGPHASSNSGDNLALRLNLEVTF